MQNKWLVWVFVIGIVVIVLFAVNYQSKKDNVPLSKIFPEENTAVSVNEEASSVTVPAVTPQAVSKTQEVQKAVSQQVETVKKEAVAQTKTATTAVSTSKSTFSIQIASFKEKEKAEKLLTQVQAKGYSAQIITRDLGAQGIWYRVNAGGFESKAQAEQTLPTIQKDFPGSFIVSVK